MLHFKRLYPETLFAMVLLFGAPNGKALPGQRRHKKAEPETHAKTPSKPPGSATQGVETERIEAPSTTPAQPATLASQAGSLRPEEIVALLKGMRFAEYRISDLLTDVKPERWKLSPPTLDSFNKTLHTLRSEMNALEQWRAQFGARTDSIYLGFQTYAAIDAVLPRLYGVARSVTEHENASYGAQFGQAGNQLFDFQQKLGAHVASLLQSQDEQILALSNNLAQCQQSLGAEMRGKAPRAVPMRNARPVRPTRRRSGHLSRGTSAGHSRLNASRATSRDRTRQ